MFEVGDYGDVQLSSALYPAIGDGGPLTVLLSPAPNAAMYACAGYLARSGPLLEPLHSGGRGPARGRASFGVNPQAGQRRAMALGRRDAADSLHELKNCVTHVVERSRWARPSWYTPRSRSGLPGCKRQATANVRAVVLLAPRRAGASRPGGGRCGDEDPSSATLPEEELRPLRQLALFSPRARCGLSPRPISHHSSTHQQHVAGLNLYAACAAAHRSQRVVGLGSAPHSPRPRCSTRAAPPQNGHQLAGEYPDRVTVVDVPRAGHAMMIEQPGAVAEAVAGFLRAQGVLVRN